MMLDKQENIMGYVFLYLNKVYCHGSSNMLSLHFPLMLAKFFAPSRELLVLPNILKLSFAMRVHHIYLWIE